MTDELEKLQRKGTKPTCPICHASILSTSQPNLMGTTPELEKLYEQFGGERCPTCNMTDAGYSVYIEGWCRDPWHADDHLRAKMYNAFGGEVNETSRDWDICRAIDLYRAPRNKGDERTLADFLNDAGLVIAALAATPAVIDSKFWCKTCNGTGRAGPSESLVPATSAVAGEREALIARADKYLNIGSGEYASEIMRDMAEYLRRTTQPASPLRGPIEPTEEMVRAAYKDQPDAINVGFAQAYRVMVAASPPEQPAAAPKETI